VRLEAHRLIELESVAVWLGRLLPLNQRGKCRSELLRCETHVSVLVHRIELEMLMMGDKGLSALSVSLHR
jgi:hypothetical protein